MTKKFWLSVVTALCLTIGLLIPMQAFADTNSVSYKVKWTGSSSIEISFDATEKGWVYWTVQDAGEDAPSESDVRTGSHWFPSSAAKSGSKTVSVSSAGAKDVYLVFQKSPSSPKVYYKMTKVALPAYSTASQTVEGEATAAGSVSFEGERSTKETASLRVTPTVDGTLHYIVKDASDTTVPTENELRSAASIPETKDITKTSEIPLGENPENAKKLYVLFVSADDSAVGGSTVMNIPAYDQSKFSAEVSPTNIVFPTQLEGYSASGISKTVNVKNTGAGTLSFDVDTSDASYAAFSNYFTVDTTGAQRIAGGNSGSVTVRPVEGLEAGTYEGDFYLKAPVAGTDGLKLGPVHVKMTVAKKGDGTVEDVREPEGEYSPSKEHIDGYPNTTKLMIDGRLGYCVNYYYSLWSSDNQASMDDMYGNQFGVIRNVTAKELDSYTGLNPDANPVVYPPNNKGFTPVKKGSADSTTLKNVRRVLYNGYDYNAAGIREKYKFALLMDNRKDYAFETATQFAIWHYTDKNSDGSDLTLDQMKTNLRRIYDKATPDWGWTDVENIYNILIGETTYKGIEIQEPDESFETDLYVVNNPINYSSTNMWTQNLITGTAKVEDVSVTKIWNDNSNADGVRPSKAAFKSWLRLYHGDTDVTSDYLEKLTIIDNGNNTYTAKWSNLPEDGTDYTVQETIPDSYKDQYTRDGSGSVPNGGSIRNSYTKLTSTKISITKKWVDNSNAYSTRPTAGQFAEWLTLSDGTQPVTGHDPQISGSGDVWTITYTGLPKYSDEGDEIHYVVTESIPDDVKYEAVYESGSGASNYGVITNRLKDTTDVTTSKTWKDSDGEVLTGDQIPSASVTFTLCRNGVPTDQTVTLDGVTDDHESEPWVAKWTGLDKYDENGKEISYSVYESSVPTGYTSSAPDKDHATTEGNISNRAMAAAEVKLKAGKALIGNGALEDKQFTFELYSVDADGNVSASPIQTAQNDENGVVQFDTLSFGASDAGTHTYQVKEQIPSDPGDITYDETVYTVTITVEVKDGKVVAEPVYTYTENGQAVETSEMLFTNRKTDAKVGKFQLKAKKTTTDHSAFAAGEFTFTICNAQGEPVYFHSATNTADTNPENGIPLTAKNDANGNIVFPVITVTEAGEKSYYIKEVTPDDSKWEVVSGGPIEVKVNMTDNGTELVPSYTYPDNADQASFTNKRKSVTLKVNKEFAAGVSGESATVVLVRNGEEMNGSEYTKTLEAPDWSAEFTDLPAVDDNGTEYTYSVKELGDNYEPSYQTNADGSITITNDQSKKEISIPVTKKWSNGATGESVTITLYRQGTGENDRTAIDRVVLTAADADNSGNWTHTFTNLKKYDANGAEYKYTFTETTDGTYSATEGWNANGDVTQGYTFTNAPSDDVKSIPVTKKWTNGASGEAEIVLKQDGQIFRRHTFKSGEEETFTFENLPRYGANGQEHFYTVEETNENYKVVSIVRNEEHDVTAGFTVTNAPSDEVISIPVRKDWIEGASGEKAYVVLKRDGEKIDGFELTEENQWSHTFENLKKYAPDGHAYKYTVDEEANNYTKTVTPIDANNVEEGFIVSNAPNTETTKIFVEKKWEGKKGEYADVKLLADGQEVDSVRLDERNVWKHTFEGLRVYTDKGKKIEYTVSEVKIEGYSVKITGNAKDGFVVTNTEKTSIPVEKKWEGKKGEYADVKLLANGKELDSVRLTESNQWKHVFEDLDKFDENGKEIRYTVSEVRMKGYTVHISGDAEHGYVITNVEEKGFLIRTGDRSNLPMYVTILAASLGLVAITIWKRRHEEEHS